MPTYSQAKKVIWDSSTNEGKRIIDFFPHQVIEKKNQQEMKIRLKNGSLFQLIGSDSVDALMGTNPKIVVFSEYALQTTDSWDFIRPILKVNGGTAIFISTPRGRNHFFDLCEMAKTQPDWYYEKLTYQDTGILTKEDVEKEIAEGMSEELALQEYECFPEGQNVMTIDGVKDIKDIKVNDLVYTHSGRFRKVLEKYERNYDGDLIKIKSYGNYEDLICTPNHPIRIYQRHTQKYQWMKAEHIKEKYRVCYPKKVLTKTSIININLVKLLAWYVCEGSCFKNGVNISLGNMSEVNQVVDLCNKLSIDCHIMNKETAINVNIYDTSYVDFFKNHCGLNSSTKKIPFTLISCHEKEFYNEMIKGDGCESFDEKSGYSKHAFTTTSKTLAYQMQILANSLGYGSGISFRKGGKSTIEGRVVNCAESYCVQIGSVSVREESTKLSRAKYCIAASVRNVEKIQFSGKVYNMKVQYDESYTVNGRAVHNCSFDRGIDGAFYAKLVTKMYNEERIIPISYDPYKLVHTSWDLGWDDSTAIVFFQIDGEIIKIIDYEEHSNKTLNWYSNLLQDKKYRYGTHLFPHDVKHVDGLSTGLTRQELLEDLGLPVTVVPKSFIVDGIEAVKVILSSRVMIDSNRCAKLLKSLENYHREYDEKRKVYSGKPKHDGSSHACDSLRYLAEGLKFVQSGRTSTNSEINAINSYWRN